MKTSFNINGINFAMSAKYMGEKYDFSQSGRNVTHNVFLVSISSGSEKSSFRFYDSFANWQKGVTELDDEALRGALNCFLSDGTCYSGCTGFEDFCKNFCYDDCKKALRAYNGCKRHHLAAVRLFGENYGELLNALYD